MALQKVVIAGGSGFVGRALTKRLLEQGSAVTILTRSASSSLPAGAARRIWNPLYDDGSGSGEWQHELRDADAVINLAGHPVVTRWNAAGKQLIEQSRLRSTNALVNAIRNLPADARPRALVSSSAVGFYGAYDSDEQSPTFDESAQPADDFLARLCARWERAATEGLRDVTDTRVVLIRTGVVLGCDGGALQRMLPAFQLFVGGTVGSGKQTVSWIHLHDLVSIYERAADDESMSGAYNATAPNAVSMDDMTRSLARALRRPCAVAVPAVALRLLYGEGSSVVLKGQRVVPRRLLQHGSFAFRYERIDAAMDAIAAAL